MDQPSEVSPARAALEVLLARVSADARHDVRGAFQLNAVLGEGQVERYHFEFGERGGPATLQVGTHPAPDVTVTAPSRLLVDMLQLRFDFRDPESIAQLSIEGDGQRLYTLHLYFYDWSPARAIVERSAEIVRRSPVLEVPRVECPSEEFVREAIERRQPLIITGAMQAWGWRCRDWNLSRLREEHGDVLVTLDATGTIALRDFIDRIATSHGRDLHTAGCSLPPSIIDTLDPPGYFSRSDFLNPLAFLGAAGATTKLHRDLQHGFAAHVFGRKRWLLYSPDQSEAVYAYESGSVIRCEVDPDTVDLEAHPRFKEARAIDVTVEAGEILLNPAGWFHHVYTLDAPALNLAFGLREERVA